MQAPVGWIVVKEQVLEADRQIEHTTDGTITGPGGSPASRNLGDALSTFLKYSTMPMRPLNMLRL